MASRPRPAPKRALRSRPSGLRLAPSSPGERGVHFAAEEQGPSGTGDTETRGKSPSRPAMRQSLVEEDFGEEDVEDVDVAEEEVMVGSEENESEEDSEEDESEEDEQNDSGVDLRFYPDADQDDDEEDEDTDVGEDDDTAAVKHDTQAPGVLSPNTIAYLQERKREAQRTVIEARVRELFWADVGAGDNGKDSAVSGALARIVGALVAWAEQHFGDDVCGKTHIDTLKRRIVWDFKRHGPELVGFVGRLAMAGEPGEGAWWELLTRKEERKAVAVAVVGRVLKEHVFGDVWFGGGEEEKRRLNGLEKSTEWQLMEGFERTRIRASMVQSFALNDDEDGVKRESFKIANRILFMLCTLLNPAKGNCHKWRQTELLSFRDGSIQDIVQYAAWLSRLMRQVPDVVYYWPPTFKDELFQPRNMDCLNLYDMIKNSPYDKKTIDGHDRAVLDDGKEAMGEAIVKVVCFPALEAYRQYGGDLGEAELEAETREDRQAPPDVQRARASYNRRNGEKSPTSQTGFRSRTLGKSVVHLMWGRQRLLTKEAGTATHMDAVKAGPAGMKKYEDDYAGFVELYDLVSKRAHGAYRSRRE